MDFTLHNLLNLLRSATGPADVFGALAGEPQAALKRRYRELVTIAHPDRNQGSSDAANEACIALQEWYAAAQRQLAQGVYGLAPRIRAATKEAHFAYLDQHKDILVLGGAMLADDGTTRIGSVLILNVPNRAAAEAFSEAEPFRKAGLFKSVKLTRMRRGQWNPDAAPKTAEGN